GFAGGFGLAPWRASASRAGDSFWPLSGSGRLGHAVFPASHSVNNASVFLHFRSCANGLIRRRVVWSWIGVVVKRPGPIGLAGVPPALDVGIQRGSMDIIPLTKQAGTWG